VTRRANLEAVDSMPKPSDAVVEKLAGMNPEDVLAMLKNGEVKCLDVLRFFQMKASEVTEKLNCVTEFILEAEVSHTFIFMAMNRELFDDKLLA
jgi:hypothetical protein